MQSIWRFIKHLFGFAEKVHTAVWLMGILGGVTVVGGIYAWVRHYLRQDVSQFTVGALIVGGSALMTVPSTLYRFYLKRRLHIDLIPSAGASTEVALRVLNHGDKQEFRAQCTLLALRNSPNALYRGTFDLKWEHTFDRSTSIGSGDSSNLIIATMQTDHRIGTAEMEILGLSGKQTKRFEWSRWNTNAKEKLSEYDLEVIVLSDGAKAISERFTLRPKIWHGPLEMIRNETV